MPKSKKTEDNGVTFYEQLLSEYDQMIDWESRLQRETPFFNQIFSDYSVKKLLDVGCGTGRHGFHFITLGIETVVGADPSTKVIELANARVAASGADIRFIEASFMNISKRLSERFDMVCTLGNSISHLLTYDDLEQTFKNLKNLLSENGVVLVQILNWDLRLADQKRFFPPTGLKTPHGDKLFFRFFDFGDELVTMNLVIFQQDANSAGTWSSRTISTTLRPWRSEIIQMALNDAGLVTAAVYGGTDLSPFRGQQSHDYIFIARKA